MPSNFKKKVWNLINLIFGIYFNILFKFHQNYSKLVIFDIDNTLTIFDKNKTKKQLILSPKLNETIIKKLKNYRQDGVKVVLLSARETHLYLRTLNWAFHNELIEDMNDLILVPNAREKIAFLKRAILKNVSVLYYDDLSYNHEHGEVKLYEEVINEVKKLKLTYYGLSEINQFLR